MRARTHRRGGIRFIQVGPVTLTVSVRRRGRRQDRPQIVEDIAYLAGVVLCTAPAWALLALAALQVR